MARSSSLVAMRLAIRAIRDGDCDQAVVAGVNAVRSVLDTMSFSQLGILNPGGISDLSVETGVSCRSSNISLVGAVVIEHHDLAVRDNNRIHRDVALVGTALTSCGSVMGSLTTPSPAVQEAAIWLSYRDAGLHPSQADFVELHGMGTVVGDATEVNPSGAVFAEGRDGRDVLIGSVESNCIYDFLGQGRDDVGEQTGASQGLVQETSSRIDFAGYNLRVPVVVEDFIPGGPTVGRIASISSYGFGGAGGHVFFWSEDRTRPGPNMTTWWLFL
ncbi:thiolase-like protein [Melanogaster broomeanus]|nr:thiolase-like protein [Melanogaster broomeanus]